jgi:MoxR-like ATPase
MSSRDTIRELKRRTTKSLIGQENVIDGLLIAMLSDGHVLTVPAPGARKALRELWPNLDTSFMRIQFTDDLLPSDLLCQPSPLFSNLILATDVNLAPPEVQAVLLAAMEDRQVTVAGRVHRLPEPFLVQAFENPFAQGTTWPLTAAQKDCFLVEVVVDEKLACQWSREAFVGSETEKPCLPVQHILEARAGVRGVFIPEVVQEYVTALLTATRRPDMCGAAVAKWIQGGASRRGAQALERCARARGWLAGRDQATPDDVRAGAHDCLRHRITLSPEALAEGVRTDQVITELVRVVAVSSARF